MSQNRIKKANQASSPMRKGDPSGEGKSKAGSKPVLEIHDAGQHDELREKYTDGPDEPAANVRVLHPNRNTDKPGLDNNSYN